MVIADMIHFCQILDWPEILLRTAAIMHIMFVLVVTKFYTVCQFTQCNPPLPGLGPAVEKKKKKTGGIFYFGCLWLFLTCKGRTVMHI